jgi:hypothetical protein
MSAASRDAPLFVLSHPQPWAIPSLKFVVRVQLSGQNGSKRRMRREVIVIVVTVRFPPKGADLDEGAHCREFMRFFTKSVGKEELLPPFKSASRAVSEERM